jgi:Uma2 family endonuclease
MAVRRGPRPTTEEAPATIQEPEPRLFTVDEYYKMAEAGILAASERVELVQGVIYTMSPIGSRHHSAVIHLNRVFSGRLLDVAEVSVQGPVRLANLTEPEPDFAIVRRQLDQRRPYEFAPPSSSDIYLIVEVADTSLGFDLGEKADTYAGDGIPELWVLDLAGDRLIVHRDPTPDGYASVQTAARGETITALAFPDITFTVDDILG